MRDRISEVVIYFKFHENRFSGLGAVRGRKSPSPTDKAHSALSLGEGDFGPWLIQQLVLPYKP